MTKFGFSALAAGLIGGAVLMFGPAPASATTLPGLTVVAPGATSLVEEARSHRRERRARRYDRRRHGSRHRYRRPGYSYYYGGYYYASPWWLAPGIGIGVAVPPPPAYGPSAHVQWCMNRYRSYDPATDTYVPRIGVRARCNSPYN